MPLIVDPQAVVVLAPELADAQALMDVLAPLGTGDVFCAAVPLIGGTADQDGEDELAALLAAEGEVDEYPYYSATVSDTVATFVVEVERGDPDSPQTRYEVHVTDVGPGADRLRYRLAKAVLELTKGAAFDADGVPTELGAPPQDPFGSLW